MRKIMWLMGLMMLSMCVVSTAQVCYSEDFSSFTTDGLNGQQGWNWPSTTNTVVTTDPKDVNNKLVRLGFWNNWSSAINSPGITGELTNGLLSISLMHRPGDYHSYDIIRVDNNQWGEAISVYFDGSSQHILVKGTSTNWYDTGFVFTGGQDYNLEILKNDATLTFSLKVNSTVIAENEPFAGAGISQLYFKGGGDGTAGNGHYSYFDNIVVRNVIPAQTPVFSPDSVSIAGPTPVTVTCGTPGATIRYTTNGSEPSVTNGIAISSGDTVTVTDRMTLKAKAFAEGYLASLTKSVTYFVGVLWNCDFEAPLYTANTNLTSPSQQGWRHPQNWASGEVESFSGGQRVRLGEWNGWGHVVMSPQIDSDKSEDIYFRICLSIIPGAGTSPFDLQIRDNAGASSIQISFSPVSSHITVKGEIGNWIDTGIAYTPGVECKLDIYKRDENHTFSLKVDGVMAAQNISTCVMGTGIGHLYIVGGGNNGTFNTSNFTYLDDIAVSVMQVTSAPVFNPGYSMITGPKAVTITCADPLATIRYTDNGTDPSETNGTVISSGSSVTVNVGRTLKAQAWRTGYLPSEITSITYTAPASCERPAKIGQGSAVTLDGQLTDWTDAPWTALDQVYDSYPGSTSALNADVPDAYYAAKWTANKVYLAIKVRDTHHVFTGSYDKWDSRDAVEVYLHAASGADGLPNYAQQYVVGLTGETTNQVWTSLAATGSVPASLNFQAAGKVDGQWLIYEVAMSPFVFFGSEAQTSIPASLEAGDVLGLDVCLVANDGLAAAPTGYSIGYTGMKGENTKPGKSWDWNQFGIHKLVAAITPGDANLDSKVDVGDLGILAANYGGSSTSWALGDFNGDNKVDVGDLGILAAHYGEGSTQRSNFSDDYAKAFSTTVTNDTEDNLTSGSSVCGALGLPLIAGLMLAGLMLVGSFKLEE